MGNCYYKNYKENKKINILLNEEYKNNSNDNIIEKLNNNDFFIYLINKF